VMLRNFRLGSAPVALVTGFTVAVAFQLLTGPGSFSRVSATAAPQSAPVLLQSQNIVYEGAFRVPKGPQGDDAHSANYGGGCMTYNAGGNNGQGSLFICGLDPARLVGEISVPQPLISSNFNALPVASLVNNFADVLEGQDRLAEVDAPDRGRLARDRRRRPRRRHGAHHHAPEGRGVDLDGQRETTPHRADARSARPSAR